ncbi:MAG: class I SAM-dependent methyltransferase [Pyrinomonadaceae bacterium]
MAKTQKELAFLRDLYIADEWTRRFAELVDKHFEFGGEEQNLLYINAGTGAHAFELRDRLDKRTNIFAAVEDEDMLTIARDKAAAIKSDVEFSMTQFDTGSFDAVIGDASFVRPEALGEFFDETLRVAETGASVGVMTVTAGSFGEIFSLLWEVLFNEDLGDHGRAAEEMITELPSVSHVEQLARDAGMVNIVTHTANEVFEYDDGKALVNSPLVGDFLIPVWLRSLGEEDQARVIERLSKLVDEEDGSLSFRFSVKATLVTGEKG